MMKRLLTLLLTILSMTVAGQTYQNYLNGNWQRLKGALQINLPPLSTGSGLLDGDIRFNPSTSKAQLWYSSAWNNLASELYVTSNTAPVSGGTNYIWNGTSAQSASWHITGQATIAGTNPYKMFLTRANMTQNAVLAFKNGTDTTGYLGLASQIRNSFMMVGLKANAEIRTRDTNDVIIGSHTPERTYLRGRAGYFTIADSIPPVPTFPLRVINSKDTSIYTDHKIVGNGLISTGNITSTAPSYSSGGITAIGRNNTTGRFETYTPTATLTSVIYGDGSLSTFPTGVDYLILRPTGNNTIELSSTATYIANAGRVALILNTTNFTYTIATTVTSSKYVWVVWYANNTPSFINL